MASETPPVEMHLTSASSSLMEDVRYVDDPVRWHHIVIRLYITHRFHLPGIELGRFGEPHEQKRKKSETQILYVDVVG